MEPSHFIKSIRLITGLGCSIAHIIMCCSGLLCFFLFELCFMSVLQRKNEDNRACNLPKHPHLTSVFSCGFLQASSRRLTRTGRPAASPPTATGMAPTMAFWPTSCQCRLDAGRSPSTSTWCVQNPSLCQLFPPVKGIQLVYNDCDLTSVLKVLSPFVCVCVCMFACFVQWVWGQKCHTRFKDCLSLSLSIPSFSSPPFVYLHLLSVMTSPSSEM